MIAAAVRSEHPIEAIAVRAYTIPTDDTIESDGTLEWSSTTMVLVEVGAGGKTGLGYTYASTAVGALIDDLLCEVLIGKDAIEIAARGSDMWRAVRNNGRHGISAMAVSAVDIALWDLKGKLLGAPVTTLLGTAHKSMAVYGSGGFTSYDERQLTKQLAHWVHEACIPRVKMKVGREPGVDGKRVAAARKVIGREANLFVDANGGYSQKQAIKMALEFADHGVSWYEEPVDHDDLAGNRFVRDHAPRGMEISNGEYGYTLTDFEMMWDAGAADVLQADVTRCGGFSGLLAVDALCQARHVPLSTHCAPYVTLPAALACKQMRHMEYFHDHVRIEKMFFEGTPDPKDGLLGADLGRPGIGLQLKRADAERYAV